MSTQSAQARPSDSYDLVIIGMGSAGMVAAEFAATLDIRVAIVERDRIGGDCLWTGCVPSKALLASAKAAHTIRHADRYGLVGSEPEIDLALVWERVRDVQRQVAETDDNAERFEQIGVTVILGAARIADPNTVVVTETGNNADTDGERRLDTRYVLVCTGSRPTAPDIDGLAAAGYLTSETLFELERPPSSIVMIGGGPIAIEMSQAFARLGIATTVLQKGGGILPRDEPELVTTLTAKLRAEGVDLHLDVDTRSVSVEDGRKVVHGTVDGVASTWQAEELLVAVGRRPNVDGLGFSELGIEVGPRGPVLDDRGRTSLSNIYVAGDLAGRYLFTHSAGYEGVRAVRDAFFPGRGTVDAAISWCTFTDPELAHTGMTVAEARDAHGDDASVWRMELTHSDRARAEGATEGAIVIVTAKGRVVGGHILAPSAGEMIHELALAISQRMKLTEIATLVHVYPTLSTGIGQLAAESAYESAKRFSWLIRRR